MPASLFAAQTPSSEATAYNMSDFGDVKKEMDVTVTSLDASSQRPVLGRRRTTDGPQIGAEAQKQIYEHEEDQLTKVGNAIWKIHSASLLTRYTLYILPVAIILAVPIILCETVFKRPLSHKTHIPIQNDNGTLSHDVVQETGPLHMGIHLVGLFIWLEELWVILWMSKFIAHYVPAIFQACCGIVSTGIRKYTIVLRNLEIPLSLLVWTCGAWSATHVITVFDDSKCNMWYDPPGNDYTDTNPCHGWPRTVRKIFLAAIVVAAIFLAEKFFMQLIAINYNRKQYDTKIRESKRMVHILDMLYDASRNAFPPFCGAFDEEDSAIQSSGTEVLRKVGTRVVRSRVLDDIGRVRDKATAAFGEMITDISGQKIFATTSAHSVVSEALDSESGAKALASRLWQSFAREGRDALYREDLAEVLGDEQTDAADQIFSALDRDDNGDVSLDEMTLLIRSIGEERKNQATTIHEIKEAIAVLDRLLSLGVLVAIALVYAGFFSPSFESKVGALWTSFAGLAFAIGGTVTEFVGCCIFLFIKHPYDVGDVVTIDGKRLVVEHVSLMYSVFRTIDSDSKTQIPHNVANALWIENISRSKFMKEKLTLSVSSSTSDEDIKALNYELQRFVTSEENRRDFQPEFDIELISIGNLKQLDLCVEIRHKSNWSNETVRTRRRNKFLTELLAACRRIPIDPPGGSSASLGSPSNPSYSVAVTDQHASEARDKHSADVEAKRLFPTGAGESYLKEALSTAFEKPVQSMRGSITGRRPTLGSVKEEKTRSSEDSIREARPKPSYPQGPYLQTPFR